MSPATQDHAWWDRSKDCDNCHQREGTLPWVGDGGALAMIHGMARMWCEHCVLEAQIAHAEQCAADLPALRDQLAALRKGA